jgi:hypothetical protein
LIDDFIGPGKVMYIGPRGTYYSEQPKDIAWGVWHRPNTDFNHFVLGTTKPVDYDPWSNEGSASVAEGKLIGKRIARIL